MKKIIVLAAALMVFATTGVFAFGLGLQANANAGSSLGPGIAITFKSDKIPLVFAANWYLGNKDQSIGVTGDYWIMNPTITKVGDGTLNWFFGVGFFTGLSFFDNAKTMQFTGGLRVPVGLNMYIAKGVIEPFIQIAPSFNIVLIPGLGTDMLFWPMSAGFRVWFK